MRLLQGPSGQIVEGSIRFKANDFKRDEKGNFIPVYEKDENGNVIFDQVLDKDGKVKLDKEGNPVLEPRQVKDENGVGVYEKEEKVFDIAKMPIKEMYRLRGRQMSMVFQEPMTSLNPVFTIGNQLDEVTLLHVPGATKELAKKRSIEMLNLVGIAMPERVYASYPHELSGGMRQRIMIAMALAGEPRLIIADEPTTALDVTIQAQVLDLFNELKTRINGSILLITHDLGVIAEMADYVVVMYAGRIIEQGTASEIFHNPCHPYTQGLQKSKPTMKSNEAQLFNIPGNVPNPVDMPNHCYFKERCSKCIGKCSGEYPCMVQVSPTHFVACHLYGAKEN
jgi:peptide/nickel transport system ATP-binding protein